MKALRIALLVALCLIPSFAHATETEFSGTSQIGEPVGIVEFTAACDPASEMNGLDGVWFDVSGLGGRPAVLGVDSLADFDVRFYDPECAAVGDSSMGSQGTGQPEFGTVPEDAAYAFVHFFSGVDGRFTLVVS